jgi:hypothetical protein
LHYGAAEKQLPELLPVDRLKEMEVRVNELWEDWGMNRYPVDTEQHMQLLYRSLSEKDRRRYAAIEAEKVGHGGLSYVAQLFGCDPQTVQQGREDLLQLPQDEAEGRIRKKGGPQAS